MPDPETHPSGANYLDETAQIVYVVIKGSSVVTVNFKPVVKMAFSIPAMTLENFNETVVIASMSTFLKVGDGKSLSSTLVTWQMVFDLYNNSTLICSETDCCFTRLSN